MKRIGPSWIIHLFALLHAAVAFGCRMGGVDDELLLTTERGQISRIPASEIRRVGRASLGVKIMNLNKNDRITGVAKIVKVAEEEAMNAENSDPENGDSETPIEVTVVPTDAPAETQTEPENENPQA